jgi:hypothetical protein
MTNTAQIMCINKIDRQNPHERITHVGGRTSQGPWKLTQEEAIQMIENKTWSFYVSVRGDTVLVIVSSRNGRKYLKTQNDGDEPNNLLSLPQCP